MKRCSRCKQILPETEFYKDKSHKDKLRSGCKDCERETYLIAQKKYRQTQKGKKSSKRQLDRIKKLGYPAQKKWTQNNKEKLRQQHRKYKQNNREKINKQLRNYWKKNPKKLKELNRRRKAERRKLKYIPLWANPFSVKSDQHHINNILTIPLPTITHRKKCNQPTHKEYCINWIEKLYCINLEKILCP